MGEGQSREDRSKQARAGYRHQDQDMKRRDTPALDPTYWSRAAAFVQSTQTAWVSAPTKKENARMIALDEVIGQPLGSMVDGPNEDPGTHKPERIWKGVTDYYRPGPGDENLAVGTMVQPQGS